MSYRMINTSSFVPVVDTGPDVYGPSAIQPSVGDSGAPVFTFVGKNLIILYITVHISFLLFKCIWIYQTLGKS